MGLRMRCLEAHRPNCSPEVSVPDRSRQALHCVHGLLVKQGLDPSETPAALKTLAEAFGSKAAGAAVLIEAVPVWKIREAVKDERTGPTPWPWQACPDLLRTDGEEAETKVVTTSAGTCLLLARVAETEGLCGVLWLEEGAPRTWSDGEKAALVLAAAVLARHFRPQLVKSDWGRVIANKRWQLQLEEAAVVTSRLAHDFGNVLTGVLGFADPALMQIPAASAAYRLVQEMYQAAQQAARMVQRLSLFSRRYSSPGQAASFGDVLEEEIAHTRPSWPAELKYEQNLPAHLPRVALDAEALGHVLGQLLANAREAIRGPGQITLSARPVTLDDSDCLHFLGNPAPGRQLEVLIADTGGGIPPETRQRLLHGVFVTTKTGHRGLGLGAVYGILQSNRGGFRLEPRAAGGTVARVVLPFVAGDLAAQKIKLLPEPYRPDGLLQAVRATLDCG
jgi:signal transduction histidine kinase